MTLEEVQAGLVLAVNKPYKLSSFGALAFVRTRLCRFFGVKKLKLGHAGTLDPLATGVLLLCTGKATKRIAELQAGQKEYIADLKFGATTPSFDREMDETEWFATEHITRELLDEALRAFVGEIDQVPPIFSACSVGGKRAYELARKDKDVELAAKRVRIDEIEVLAYDDVAKTARLRVVCGKGTYIRSLARDLGVALRSGAYLTDLCRTRVGDYRIENALTFDDIRQQYEIITI